MYSIRPEFCILYSSFLQDIRAFFKRQGFLELETPLMSSTANVEAYLDSFQVLGKEKFRKSAHTAPHSRSKAYLITSPEYHLKILLAHVRRDLYQIAHCFRAGDLGPVNMEEFMMLEWYLTNADEFELMDQSAELLRFLSRGRYSHCKLEQKKNFLRRSVRSVLEEYAGCGWEREDLEEALLKNKLIQTGQKPSKDTCKKMNYADLFFSVFLNLVEPHLGKDGPEFLYHYPPALSAFSQVEKGYARRFELYWNNLELANGYYELRRKEDYIKRFAKENALRKELDKESVSPNETFLDHLEQCQGLPRCSGIALGLDRLFLALLNEKKLSSVYAYSYS